MKTRQVITYHGTMEVPEKDWVLGQSLIRLGEWAKDDIEIADQFIWPGSTVLDLGACLGTHTLSFAKFVGALGHVHAFEPQPDVIPVLERNLELNNVTNVTVHKAAVSNLPGELTLMTLDPNSDNWRNYGMVKLQTQADDVLTVPVKVPTITIDSLDLKDVSFIKIDIEGHEPEALGGGRCTILRDRPVMWIEGNHPQAKSRVETVLESFGYMYSDVGSSYYRGDNFTGYPRNPFPFLPPEPYMLCFPRERSEEIMALGKTHPQVFLQVRGPMQVGGW